MKTNAKPVVSTMFLLCFLVVSVGCAVWENVKTMSKENDILLLQAVIEQVLVMKPDWRDGAHKIAAKLVLYGEYSDLDKLQEIVEEEADGFDLLPASRAYVQQLIVAVRTGLEEHLKNTPRTKDRIDRTRAFVGWFYEVTK